MAKRGLDIGISAVLLLILLPFLLLVALAVVLESHGPVLFRQRRTGLNGRPFTILKFRTMTVCEDGEEVKAACRADPRCTRLGRILRQTSLDELPQLINVLRGDMSLVGPRPHALVHDRQFAAQAPAYPLRFCARPGITGLAQTRGHRGELHSTEELSERLACDLEYIERWNLWLDLKLLVASARVLRHDKAY